MMVKGTIYGLHGFEAAFWLTPTGAKAVVKDATRSPEMREALLRRFPGHAVEVQGMRIGGEWATVGVAAKARIGGDP